MTAENRPGPLDPLLLVASPGASAAPHPSHESSGVARMGGADIVCLGCGMVLFRRHPRTLTRAALAPCPHSRQQLVGVPTGQYRCGYCGAMVIAGAPHLDYAGGESP